MVIPYLRRHGGAVALFVLSHPHDDHAGGARSVRRRGGSPRS
jgi:competence protein ComEC